MSDGMERFSDYFEGKMPKGVKLKIVVPTPNDAEHVKQALKYLHNGDMDISPVSTLVHASLRDPFVPSAICVNEGEYERVCSLVKKDIQGYERFCESVEKEAKKGPKGR